MFAPILKRFTNNQRLIVALDFVLKVLAGYLLWKIFHYWASIPGTKVNLWFGQFNNRVAEITVLHTALILKALGYQLIYTSRNIFVAGTNGLYVANHCLGIPPAVIFSAFILAYQGRWLHKLWYIPVGILCIYAINVARIVALGITQDCCSALSFELAHSWVYLAACYGMFFLLIMGWMNTLSKK